MKKKHSFCTKFILPFAMCMSFFVYAQVLPIPDSSECRKGLIETWFRQDLAFVRQQEPLIVHNSGDEYFLVRSEEAEGLVRIIVAPQERHLIKLQTLSNADTAPNLLESEGSNNLEQDDGQGGHWVDTWPENAPGAWILYRDGKTGRPLRVRYYFSPDSAVFVEFTSGTDKCFADFSIFGALAASKVPIPAVINWFFTASLKDVQGLTRYTLPWNYAKLNMQIYDDSMQMTGFIRELLPALARAEWFREAEGNLHFLKWIAGGLIKPLTGGIILDEALKKSTIKTNLSEPFNGDTYAALDYTRNLAAALISAQTGHTYYHNTSGADVKTEPFYVYTDSQGLQQKAGFVGNSGYPIDMLKPLFYVLALTEPGRFFFGAVRRLSPASSPKGQTPEQYLFDKAAAFFTWLDKQGRLQVTVFERGREFSLEEFIKNNKDTFVHLVRIKASKNFYPDTPQQKIEMGSE